MPGRLEMRLPRTYAGKTPARTILTWLERALEVTDEQHAQQEMKPYACEAWQAGADVAVRITVATLAQLEQVTRAAQERMGFQGEWVTPIIHGSEFLVASSLLVTAPPRTMLDLSTRTPTIFCNNGYDDPILTKERLFATAKKRWESIEGDVAPVFSSNENAEVWSVQGGSALFQGHALRRGWQGHMTLKLRGPQERIVNGNALLMYLELWGVGRATTVGAGRFDLRSHAERRRAR